MATLSLLVATTLLVFAPKVTLHERAQPLSVLLPKLGPLVERRLAAHPALAREWVVVDVRDADPEELLAKVAEVTHAEWIQEGGEWRVKRSAETERKLLAEDRAAQAASLRSQWTEALRAPFDAAVAGRRRRDAMIHEAAGDGDSTPKSYPGAMAVLDRYLNELLLQIPIETITSLPDRRGFVMSNRPQASQRALPVSALPVVERMFRDYEAFAGVMRTVDEEAYPDAAPVRLKLSLSAHRQTPSRARYFAQLVVLDERGRGLGSSARPFQTPPPPRYSPVPGPPFALSEKANELEKVLQREIPFDRAAPAIRELMLNPEREGRLSQLWSDVMFGLAAREARSLVANLPDVAELHAIPLREGPVSLDSYLRRLTTVEFRREGKWLTAWPRHPGPVGRYRADRAAVGWAVRTVAAGKSIPLEEAAQLEYRLGRSRWPMSTRHESVDPTGGAAIASLEVFEPGHDVLRLLPPNMLAALYEGRPLAFGILPTQLQTALRNLYLQSGAYMVLLVPDREGEPESGEGIEMSDVIGPAQVSGLVLRAKVTQSWAFVGRASEATHKRMLLEPSALLRYLDDDLRPRRFPTDEQGESETVYDQVQVIRSRRIDLAVHFPNGYRQDVSMDDYQFDPREPFVSVDRLPKAILDHLRQLKREQVGGGSEDGRVSEVSGV
ncbi:MAG: hypothetical protein ACO1SV_00105 [Fimbriimonas sp.]